MRSTCAAFLPKEVALPGREALFVATVQERLTAGGFRLASGERECCDKKQKSHCDNPQCGMRLLIRAL